VRPHVVACAFGLALGCAGCSTDFDPPSLVNTVRILALQANSPFAAPAESVTLSVLAADGRTNKPAPMALYWLPRVCENPSEDLYYNCYAAFGEQFPAGVDLTASLATGATFGFTMPADAVATHARIAGHATPYGVVFAFVMACAGHVEYTPPNPATESPATIPFGCFDADHNALGSDDFVFAFMRVYAYATLRNANPVIASLTYGEASVDAAAGLTLAHCGASTESSCSQVNFQTQVPTSSQEPDPESARADGQPEKEAIWVDYFITAGKVQTDSVLLYDPTAGPVASTADGYAAPLSAGSQTLWTVVHDNRGGVSWLTVPLQVQ
jgi:hypothetical protein